MLLISINHHFILFISIYWSGNGSIVVRSVTLCIVYFGFDRSGEIFLFLEKMISITIIRVLLAVFCQWISMSQSEKFAVHRNIDVAPWIINF